MMFPTVTANTALLLDIDGTLLDLARTPDRVVVPRALRLALERLDRDLGGALAFVSGRTLESIDSLFAPFRPAAIGTHGAEIRGADGTVERAPPLPEDIRALFRTLAAAAPGLLLEDKASALSLHYRLAPEARSMLEAALAGQAALLAAENLQVIHGKAVIDVRRAGLDKGSAVRRLVRRAPFAGRRVLFGGDDTTDADVFRILPEIGGHGFSVGRHFAGADHLFETPRAVRGWLAGLAEAGVS
jgi:trehalose 6-phosphate phosphatase